MFVNAKEMLKKAAAEKYAVAQININNLEWTKAALTTAQEQKSPLILGVTGGAAKVRVLVIPTNEELVIARDTKSILNF